MAAVLKTARTGDRSRGFESHALRVVQVPTPVDRQERGSAGVRRGGPVHWSINGVAVLTIDRITIEAAHKDSGPETDPARTT
jgi:hypothetical protein